MSAARESESYRGEQGKESDRETRDDAVPCLQKRGHASGKALMIKQKFYSEFGKQRMKLLKQSQHN